MFHIVNHVFGYLILGRLRIAFQFFDIFIYLDIFNEIVDSFCCVNNKIQARMKLCSFVIYRYQLNTS